MKSPTFARIAVAAASVALGSLALLHVLRPDLSPGSHMISEYAIGPWSGLSTLSFLGFSAASFALLFASASRLRSWTGRAALVSLFLAGVGAAIGGLFAIDPTTTDPERMSFSGHMHGIGFMIGVPGELLAVLLLSIAARRTKEWPATTLGLLAALAWLSLLTMVPLLLAGHDFGIPNRLFMAFYGAFLIVAARRIAGAATAAEPGAQADVRVPAE